MTHRSNLQQKKIALQMMEDMDDKANQGVDTGAFYSQDDGGPVDFGKPTLFIANTKEPEKQIPKLKVLPSHLEKEWGDKLDDVLWTFRNPYNSPIRSSPFRIVYGKACHLLIKIEHKAYWTLRNVNPDLDVVGKHRFLQLNELAKLRNKAYEHCRTYKDRTKHWHDSKIMDKEFHEGEEILVFNSSLKLFPGKLKTRWYGPYTVSKVFPYRAIEVCGKNGVSYKASGHRLKKYYGGDIHDVDEDLQFAKT
nr:reverse transcriptase domain-containing protein [Tanacetum cinerariifolium]